MFCMIHWLKFTAMIFFLNWNDTGKKNSPLKISLKIFWWNKWKLSQYKCNASHWNATTYLLNVISSFMVNWLPYGWVVQCNIIPLCYRRKTTIFLCWAVEDEFRGLTARGKRLLCSLVIWHQILLYLLPESSRGNRLWLGWILSFCILLTLCIHIISLINNTNNRAFCSGPFTNHASLWCFKSSSVLSLLMLLCKSNSIFCLEMRQIYLDWHCAKVLYR